MMICHYNFFFIKTYQPTITLRKCPAIKALKHGRCSVKTYHTPTINFMIREEFF